MADLIETGYGVLRTDTGMIIEIILPSTEEIFDLYFIYWLSFCFFKMRYCVDDNAHSIWLCIGASGNGNGGKSEKSEKKKTRREKKTRTTKKESKTFLYFINFVIVKVLSSLVMKGSSEKEFLFFSAPLFRLGSELCCWN